MQQKVRVEGQTLYLLCFVIRRVMCLIQELCTDRKALILGQSIQFLESSLYFVLPPQQLDVFLCETLEHQQCICDCALTELPLLNYVL